jgi:hypothetical protein
MKNFILTLTLLVTTLSFAQKENNIAGKLITSKIEGNDITLFISAFPKEGESEMLYFKMNYDEFGMILAEVVTLKTKNYVEVSNGVYIMRYSDGAFIFLKDINKVTYRGRLLDPTDAFKLINKY